MQDLSRIIIKPVISEKSLRDANSGKYTFLVDMRATKPDIKKAIHALFEVDVKKVYTNIIKGGLVKSTVIGRRRVNIKSSSKGIKKARVTLAKDQKIALFEEAVKKG